MDATQGNSLEDEVIKALRTVYDPEIPVNIYDLGLIYKIGVDADNVVQIQMTLTSPGCPVAGSLPPEVQQKVASVSGVKEAQVELTWEPPWHPNMMCEAAKLQLGFL
jgi:FeS assembly SUF system protein